MWQGQAGEAASSYFTQLASSASDLRGPLGDIGHEYKVMSDSVWSVNEALGGIVKGLVDSAIIAGIAAAAGTATSATGVGAVLGYGVAAAEVAYMLKLWGQATQLYQHATAAVLAFRSALTHRLGDLESASLPDYGTGRGRFNVPGLGSRLGRASWSTSRNASWVSVSTFMYRCGCRLRRGASTTISTPCSRSPIATTMSQSSDPGYRHRGLLRPEVTRSSERKTGAPRLASRPGGALRRVQELSRELLQFRPQLRELLRGKQFKLTHLLGLDDAGPASVDRVGATA